MIELAQSETLNLILAQQLPYLKFLVLFGSQATGHVHFNSDWDFGVMYDEEYWAGEQEGFRRFEVDHVLAQVFAIVGDKVDVVELNHCSPLLGFMVARDGQLLYEREEGEFIKFHSKAWKTYADTEKFRQAGRESIKLSLQRWGL
ncbi:type VII toxin-antitoxin system MntA family adenylyltransferase antitoxin [Candidatus Cyanaurora vandensis]|uniref:type VII toxin-antitoxin system MntA family adenylyltransferase antitoxin n=1 Tax=Candidatus Cyanaurora vandensis TaxID=2714958 RepID=UPI00257942F9|nr:nucleotidyltransferase domain-containing protein [Candidatus Cyanaurora vandensis]